jgi:hypothetical protein
MRQRAHSTRSSGTGSGDRARVAQPIVGSHAITSAMAVYRILMIVPPHVTFEHSFVAAELELARGFRFEAAVAEQHDARRQMSHVGRDVRRE